MRELSRIPPEPFPPNRHSSQLYSGDSCINSIFVPSRVSTVSERLSRTHGSCQKTLKPKFKGSCLRHTQKDLLCRSSITSYTSYLKSTNYSKGSIQPSCIGAGSDGEAFFASTTMLCELDRIKEDYRKLLNLGEKFHEFDRDGKLLYIQEMQNVLERWKIFYKRMQLSDDFIAKLCAKQLKLQVDHEGSSNVDMVDAFYDTMEEMRKSIEADL